MMRYLSVCSGIEAATVAWHPLGWEPAAFSEIEKFPRAVLTHHYPDVPLHGDFTTIGADEYGTIDLLVGGTPCQSFSVAGLRGGLDDDRGNLALEFLRLAQRTRPKWLVWENVPGVLSSSGGRDFGAILGGMVELGYGFAYRICDAQFFGVPQRRRRVFVVGYLGDWRRAAAVLFERHSLQGHPAPRREKREDVAGVLTSRASGGGGGPGAGTDEAAAGYLQPVITSDIDRTIGTLCESSGHARPGDNIQSVDYLIPSTGYVSHCLNAGGMGRQDYETETLVAFGMATQQEPKWSEELCPTLQVPSKSGGGQPHCVAFDTTQITSPGNYSNPKPGDPCHPLAAGADSPVITAPAVRRLTPRECERLQGFPDVQKCYTILVCQNPSDQQKSDVLAALQCRKLQSNAWLAEASGWMLSAEAAVHHSSTSHHDHAPPVAVDVLIDLERQAVRLHSAGRSFSLASNADGRNGFPLPTGIDSFAHLAALTTQVWEKAAPAGKVGSQANTTPSTPRLNGSGIAISFGREIEERASDAATAIEMASRVSTSITLPSGADTASLHSTLATLCCCVVHAIAGFIPETTSKAPSFAVRLTTSQGYTLVPYRNKPADQCPDGPRYKALGNSMAAPVMRWIGERIEMVSKLA